MKNLYLLRHAKSSWDDFALKDFDRPLSTRGIQDADLMGNFFKSKRKGLDLVVSSPSKELKKLLIISLTKLLKILFLMKLYIIHLNKIYIQF